VPKIAKTQALTASPSLKQKNRCPYPEFNPGVIGIHLQRGDLTVKNLTTSQACEGLVLYKTATGKSHHSIRNYRNSYKRLLLYFADDPPFALITRDQLVAFFAWLQEEYVSEPDGVAPRGLSWPNISSVRQLGDMMVSRAAASGNRDANRPIRDER
jgi:hypothetical protein